MAKLAVLIDWARDESAKRVKKKLDPLVQAGLVKAVQTRKTMKFSFKWSKLADNNYKLASPAEEDIYVILDSAREHDLSIYLRCHCAGKADFCDASFTISFYGADEVHIKESNASKVVHHISVSKSSTTAKMFLSALTYSMRLLFDDPHGATSHKAGHGLSEFPSSSR
uniref:Uncharacterized protein n=1 Tax=Ditylenchus dipsaci TaxID=166011 RepID=A0A915CZ83_9BILA